MKSITLIIHIVTAITLVTLILLQTSKGGLSAAFGGEGFYRTKRGAERIVFLATIATAGLFLATSVINLIIR